MLILSKPNPKENLSCGRQTQAAGELGAAVSQRHRPQLPGFLLPGCRWAHLSAAPGGRVPMHCAWPSSCCCDPGPCRGRSGHVSSLWTVLHADYSRSLLMLSSASSVAAWMNRAFPCQQRSLCGASGSTADQRSWRTSSQPSRDLPRSCLRLPELGWKQKPWSLGWWAAWLRSCPREESSPSL
ncbi:uncharacterized protein LOC106007704 isoform X6 [Heterocephalus glaber]|uniref:Uncharacterized protein LOC106007704 isoform X6 n=1 Tax=Heterocephalus glaber TaxID=10181 RepID=A0AAX6RP14_HETGA|nr:uncharacterized protein LOC106007704 isoform X6 [Heterocephalus glaber]XP_021098210.1 uncharacterized protein LOC106007704 isoform X6 [Heterocephalus glaber]